MFLNIIERKIEKHTIRRKVTAVVRVMTHFAWFVQQVLIAGETVLRHL